VVPRAVPVVEAMAAMVLADAAHDGGGRKVKAPGNIRASGG